MNVVTRFLLWLAWTGNVWKQDKDMYLTDDELRNMAHDPDISDEMRQGSREILARRAVLADKLADAADDDQDAG